MSYGAARAFGTARVMHICSRYAAVSVANTSLYYGALQLRQLCALVMLRRHASLHRHSAQLFQLRISVLLSSSVFDSFDDTSWTHELHLPWEDGDHELSTVSMALASWNCPELLLILSSSSVPIMGSFGYDPRNRDPRALDSSGPRP